MTDVEVALADLGEIATREIAKKKNPKGINASTLPNKLARNARIPTTSLYI